MSTVTTTAATLHLSDDNPWPGLDTYSEAAQRFFHGREADSAEMLRLIRVSSFVMLYGKSGLGKSSMLQAGVFPPLRAARFLPVYLRLDYTESAERTPLQQALARLQQEVRATGVDAPPPEPGESLWAYLQRRERPIWTADNFPLTPVLVFDQFEEVFSRGGSAAHIKQMLDSIADLVGDRMTSELAADPAAAQRLNLQSQQYRVVLSFRSDFLAEVESWQRQASLPKHEALHLKAMTRETAIQAVERAGAAVVEPGVAAQIVDFVLDRDEAATAGGATEVEPVLLSLCCYQLNSRRQRPAKIDSALLASVGSNILRDFYREALAGTAPRVSTFIEDNLILGGRYRSNFPREEALASGALTAAELELLTHRRLLRVDPQGDVPRIELIHDRLVGVVRDAKEARLAHERQQIEHAEAEKLASAEREKERTRNAIRSRNVLIGAFLLLGMLTVGLMYKANEAAELTERAQALLLEAVGRRLAADAQSMLAGTREGSDTQAFQQLLASRELRPGTDSESALLKALVARQHLRRFEPTVVTTKSSAIALAFSPRPHNRWLALGHADGSVSLRRAQSPQDDLLPPQRGHEGRVNSIAFSPDSCQLVSAGDDGTLRRWRLGPCPPAPEGEPVLAPEGDPMQGDGAPVYSAAFSFDGQLIVSGGADGKVRFWRAKTGAPAGEPVALGTGPVRAVAFRPNDADRTVAAGSGVDGEGRSRIRLVNVGKRSVGPPHYAHSQDTLALAFSESGSHLVTGGADGTVRVRALDTPRVRALEVGTATSVRIDAHEDDVKTVAFSPDGRWVASGSADRSVRLWEASSGTALGQRLGGHTGAVTSVVFSPDGRWLATAAEDRTLRLWQLDPDWAAGAFLRGPLERASAVALAREGRMVVTGTSQGAVVVDDQTETEPKYTSIPSSPAPRGAQPPVSCGTPDHGAEAAPEAKDSPPPAQALERGVRGVAVSGDGRAIASVHQDGMLRLWNNESGQPLGQPVHIGDCPLAAVAWSRDGQRLAVSTIDGQALLLDGSGRLLKRKLGGAGAGQALALSADGRWLAAAGSDSLLQLLDTKRFQDAPVRLEGVLEDLSSLAFSGDGRYLVTGSTTGNIRIWDTGHPPGNGSPGAETAPHPLSKPLAAHPGSVLAIYFSKDGSRFFSVGRDGAVRPWPAPAQWPLLMCSKLDTNLNLKMWNEWVSPAIRYRCACPDLPVEPVDGLAESSETCPAPDRSAPGAPKV